jgi:predicted Zn-dependent protease
LVLRRNGLRVQAQVQPAVVCDFPVTIGASDKVNAYADGDRMIVTQGMLRFVQNDQELAVVLGHELAHNAMGHLSAKTANSVMGGAGGFMLDVLVAAAGVNTGGAFTRMGMKAGADAFSTDFEREADYVGLYMIARAGFEIEAAPNFWRRMGMRQPGSIEHASTHPSTADRAVALEGTVAEVRRKQAAGLPLVPDMKPKVETQTKLESGGAK